MGFWTFLKSKRDLQASLSRAEEEKQLLKEIYDVCIKMLSSGEIRQKIISSYATSVSNGSFIQSDLPFPKFLIRRAILIELFTFPDAKRKDGLMQLLLMLEDFAPSKYANDLKNARKILASANRGQTTEPSNGRLDPSLITFFSVKREGHARYMQRLNQLEGFLKLIEPEI